MLQSQRVGSSGVASEVTCGRCGHEGPAGMRFCGACGAPLRPVAPPERANGDASSVQRRHMTVMFCDVVDSTSLAEQLDPEDFREVLGYYQRACTTAIERVNGYVAQYLGDGVVAYFGYPRAHEDDAQRAVHASLGILDELHAVNERLGELHDLAVEVRIGLHTGLVVAGEMGTGPAGEQLAIVGEAPHIAARLQSVALPGTVVMTDATRDLVAGHFEIAPLGTRELKGISRPIAVHQVLGPIGSGRGPLGVSRRRPMVDRANE